MGVIILSIDPGINNLGYSLIQLNTNLVKEGKNGLNSNKINFTNLDNPKLFFEDNKTEFKELQNVNIFNGSGKCNVYDKVVNLLNEIVVQLDLENNYFYIILEKQMKISVKISEIASIINTFFYTYFLLNKDKKYKYEIVTISPHFKNKIAAVMDPENKIRIKFINQYQYNKFIVELYFLKLNEELKIIDVENYVNGSGKHVAKLNDISDSFIQILSFIIYYLNAKKTKSKIK